MHHDVQMVCPCLVPPTPITWDIFRVLMVAMVTPAKLKEEIEDPNGPFSGWLRWGHIGVTLAVIVFTYSVYNDIRKHDTEDAQAFYLLSSRVLVIESEYKHQGETDKGQSDILAKQLILLTQRIDAQREDIRALQLVILRHLEVQRAVVK